MATELEHVLTAMASDDADDVLLAWEMDVYPVATRIRASTRETYADQESANVAAVEMCAAFEAAGYEFVGGLVGATHAHDDSGAQPWRGTTNVTLRRRAEPA